MPRVLLHHQPRRRAHPRHAPWTRSCGRFARRAGARRWSPPAARATRAGSRPRAWRRGWTSWRCSAATAPPCRPRRRWSAPTWPRRHPGRHRQPAGRQPPDPVGAGPRRPGARHRAAAGRSTSAAWSAPDGIALLRGGLRRGLRRAGHGRDADRAQAALGHGGVRGHHPPPDRRDPQHRPHHHDRRRRLRRQRRDGAGRQLRRGDPALRPARAPASGPTTGCSTWWSCGPTASGRACGPSGTCSGWPRRSRGWTPTSGYARGPGSPGREPSRPAGPARRRARRRDAVHGHGGPQGDQHHGARRVRLAVGARGD